MASRYEGKPCARCGGNKGAKYTRRKYCGNCFYIIKKERSSNAHAKALESRYGITRTDYWDLYSYQGERCAICRRATGRSRRLSVDHDHKTGIVRGLLCRPCNNFLGHLRDSPEAFLRAADFLINPPFARMLASKKQANGASHGNTRGDSEGERGDLST